MTYGRYGIVRIAREHFIIEEAQLGLQGVPLIGSVSKGPHAQHAEAQLLSFLKCLNHLRRESACLRYI